VTLSTGDARKVLDLLLNFEHVVLVVYLSNHGLSTTLSNSYFVHWLVNVNV